MSYKIIADSCCDLTAEMKEWNNLTVIPLTLQIGDYVIQDDENFNQDDFIRRMTSSKELAKSACPSPDAFAKACEGDEDEVYILTITDKLSGCYNSALQGVALYNDEHPESTKKSTFSIHLQHQVLKQLWLTKSKSLQITALLLMSLLKLLKISALRTVHFTFILKALMHLKATADYLIWQQRLLNPCVLSSYAAEQITATFQLQARIYPKTEY